VEVVVAAAVAVQASLVVRSRTAHLEMRTQAVSAGARLAALRVDLSTTPVVVEAVRSHVAEVGVAV